jgi:hypothetical protein
MPLEHVSNVELNNDPVVGAPKVVIKFAFMGLEKEIEYSDEELARELVQGIRDELETFGESAQSASGRACDIMESLRKLIETVQSKEGETDKVSAEQVLKEPAREVPEESSETDEQRGGFPDRFEGEGEPSPTYE